MAEFFVSGQLSGVLEERRIEKMIDSFSDHYIVCGFGRVGRQVSRDLRADRVISPYKTSGSEMARLALRPQVGGALDTADYRMEEIEVSPECEGVGKTIGDVSGADVIVAIRHPDGRLETQPPAPTELRVGDMIIAMGPPPAVERLDRMFQPPRGVSPIRGAIRRL